MNTNKELDIVELTDIARVRLNKYVPNEQIREMLVKSAEKEHYCSCNITQLYGPYTSEQVYNVADELNNPNLDEESLNNSLTELEFMISDEGQAKYSPASSCSFGVRCI